MKHLKHIYCFIILILLLSMSLVQADSSSKNVMLVERGESFSKEEKVAVVVGISEYDQVNTGFRKLDYAAIDAEKISEALKGGGYHHIKQLLNTQASKSVILKAIRNAGKRIKQGEGTLIFAFSGHGMMNDGDNYLATSGSIAEDLSGSGLSVSEIIHAIKQTGVKRAILFLDACRNDPLPGQKSVGVEGFLNKNYGEGIQVLYATAQNEVSWEHKLLQRGVFSHFLTLGLEGKAAHNNGIITFNSLATYVEQEVLNWTVDKVSQTQRPFRNSEGETRGNFVLARLVSNEREKTLVKSFMECTAELAKFIHNSSILRKRSNDSYGSSVSELANRLPIGKNLIVTESSSSSGYATSKYLTLKGKLKNSDNFTVEATETFSAADTGYSHKSYINLNGLTSSVIRDALEQSGIEILSIHEEKTNDEKLKISSTCQIKLGSEKLVSSQGKVIACTNNQPCAY